MAYYDRLVDDPAGALLDAANREGISVEDLRERIRTIHQAAAMGGHLTLGDALSFVESPESLAETSKGHLDNCLYCKAMVDGLVPERIVSSIEVFVKKAGPNAVGSGGLAVLWNRPEWRPGWRAGRVVAGLAVAFGLAWGILAIQSNSAKNTAAPSPTLMTADMSPRLTWPGDSISNSSGLKDVSTISGDAVGISCTLLNNSSATSTVVCTEPAKPRFLAIRRDVRQGTSVLSFEPPFTFLSAHASKEAADSAKFGTSPIKSGDQLIWEAKTDAPLTQAGAIRAALMALDTAAASPAKGQVSQVDNLQ